MMPGIVAGDHKLAIAPVPENEKERLKALESYDLMDQDVGPVFDKIIRIAADVCEVDISVIALIGEERQYFLSRNNMEPRETPRAIAFCAHAILEPDELFEIENATEDPRFRDNPLVTGEIGVRFYAACPLTTADGLAIGGLCLIGKKPKSLNNVQRDTLRRLGDVIMNLFETRKAQMQSAQEILEAKRAADAQNQAKTLFLSSMSHELRTPLNAVIGYSDFLETEAFGPLGHKKYKQYASAIKASGDHLYALIDDILDVSRLEMGGLELDDLVIYMDEQLESCREIIESQLQKADVALAIGIAIDKPTLKGDPVRFRQVVLNLLSNALKFTPEKGRISVSVFLSDDNRIIMRVADTGIGIAPENLAKVMEPFQQVRENPHLAHMGSGLGLPLSKGLVELHGGTFDLESTVGEGTTVTITFPPERTLVREQ